MTARNTSGFEARLQPGDRLFLMSDGITEAEDSAGNQLGEEGLARLMRRASHLGGTPFLEALVRNLSDHTGPEFADDVSGVFLEFHGT